MPEPDVTDPAGVRVFWSTDDDAFIAVYPLAPYLSAFGPTEAQARQEMAIVLEMVQEIAVEEGREWPPHA
jgi:predicted RNase H-like HicB family nuclease